MSILAGELGSMGVASVLQILARSRNAGRIRLKRGQQEAEIAVRGGKILWARLNWGHRLGEALVTRRRLSPELCSMALRYQREGRTRMPLGTVLVALGLAERDDIAQEVKRMTHRAMCEVLLWDDGEYNVEPLADNAEGVPSPESIESMLLSLAA